MADHFQVGIAGTFDLQNFGDLLFPLVAEAELSRRLGAVKVRPFAYAAKARPEWPFDVNSVADLPDVVAGLDAMLIGGGHIVRFDKSIAPNYAPPNFDVHHPTGYWLMPALMAQQHGVPVVWNAIGSYGSVPAWAEPLMRTALADSAYIAVRDEDAFNTLAPLASGKTINRVPDTCFGVSSLVDAARPSEEYQAIREALGLNHPYIFVQATSGLEAFGAFMRQHGDTLSVKKAIAVPVGLVLGDNNDQIGRLFDGLLTLSHWPSPLAFTELIAGAQAVVGTSMHMAITALSFGVPVFRPASPWGKYAVLSQHDSVFEFPDADGIAPEWFEARLGGRGIGAKALANKLALKRYWDHVASVVKRPRDAVNRTRSVLSKFSLPIALELQADLEANAEAARKDVGLLRDNVARVQQDADVAGEKARALETRLHEVVSRSEAQSFEITRLNRQAEALRARVAADAAYLSDVQKSTSWRVTAPLRWVKSRLNGSARTESPILRFSAIAEEQLKREPFDWAFANNVFSSVEGHALAQSYPHDRFKTVKGYDGEKGYEYEARALIHMGQDEIAFADGLSTHWRRLARDLLSPSYRQAVSALTGRDLTSAPMEAYVCHFGAGAWLGPHVDLLDKIMTHVFYFNEAWNPEDGGCLNILRSKDMDDRVAEVAPIVGNTSVLVRSDTSWHAVSKVRPGTPSRRSMNVIFYRDGAVSTMWPRGETPSLHDYRPAAR